MASFAPWAAALAGFRLVRERPLSVPAWAGVIFLGRLAGLVLTTAMSGRYMPALDAAVNAKTIDPQAVALAYQPVAPGYLAGAVLAMPFIAVVVAAIYRAYLRPQEGRGCFLRLGRSEGAVLVLIISLNLLVMVGLFFAAAMIATLANLVAAADQASGALVEIAGLGGSLFFLVWAMARLSLAWPMTFQSDRLVLFRSWRLTKAQAWPLLGAFVMAEALMVLVAILLFAVCAGLAGAAVVAMGGTIDQMSEALRPATRVAELFQPLPMVFLAFEALLLTLVATTLQGVAVSAYHSLDPQEIDAATPAWR